MKFGPFFKSNKEGTYLGISRALRDWIETENKISDFSLIRKWRKLKRLQVLLMRLFQEITKAMKENRL